MQGVVIKEGQVVKYLGAILTTKLFLKNHVEEACNKFTSALQFCRWTIGLNAGLRPKVFIWILETILISRLFYGAVVR